jgi:hypothetical protein
MSTLPDRAAHQRRLREIIGRHRGAYGGMDSLNVSELESEFGHLLDECVQEALDWQAWAEVPPGIRIRAADDGGPDVTEERADLILAAGGDVWVVKPDPDSDHRAVFPGMKLRVEGRRKSMADMRSRKLATVTPTVGRGYTPEEAWCLQAMLGLAAGLAARANKIADPYGKLNAIREPAGFRDLEEKEQDRLWMLAGYMLATGRYSVQEAFDETIASHREEQAAGHDKQHS